MISHSVKIYPATLTSPFVFFGKVNSISFSVPYFFDAGFMSISYRKTTFHFILILKCFTLCCQGGLVYLRAKAVPEERQSQPPYDVWVQVDRNGTINFGGCTCVA